MFPSGVSGRFRIKGNEGTRRNDGGFHSVGIGYGGVKWQVAST